MWFFMNVLNVLLLFFFKCLNIDDVVIFFMNFVCVLGCCLLLWINRWILLILGIVWISFLSIILFRKLVVLVMRMCLLWSCLRILDDFLVLNCGVVMGRIFFLLLIFIVVLIVCWWEICLIICVGWIYCILWVMIFDGDWFLYNQGDSVVIYSKVML